MVAERMAQGARLQEQGTGWVGSGWVGGWVGARVWCGCVWVCGCDLGHTAPVYSGLMSGCGAVWVPEEVSGT